MQQGCAHPCTLTGALMGPSEQGSHHSTATVLGGQEDRDPRAAFRHGAPRLSSPVGTTGTRSTGSPRPSPSTVPTQGSPHTSGLGACHPPPPAPADAGGFLAAGAAPAAGTEPVWPRVQLQPNRHNGREDGAHALSVAKGRIQNAPPQPHTPQQPWGYTKHGDTHCKTRAGQELTVLVGLA